MGGCFPTIQSVGGNRYFDQERRTGWREAKEEVEGHSAACDEIKEKLAATKAIPEEEDHTVGTFSGEEDHVVRTREGEPVPGDTGDQGGGQN